MTPAALAERLAHDTNPEVRGWAERVDVRVSRRELNLDRAYARLLEPFVTAGLVAGTSEGFAITNAGLLVTGEMLDQASVS